MELEKARDLTLQLAHEAGVEWVGPDGALGRVLAEDVRAVRSLPSRPRSRFDGYALCSEDSMAARADFPIQLDLLPGILTAADSHHKSVAAGQCIRILTGARPPKGTDAVVPEEEVLSAGNRLEIRRTVPAGGGILPAGSDILQGELFLSKGSFLTPSRLAMLVAMGIARLPVFRRPVVALLATGDEIIELGQPAEGSTIFCNSRYLLGWLATLNGAEVIHLGVSRDDPHTIASFLEEVKADILITTGGTGQGERDCVSKAWKLLRVETLFRKLNVSPGKNASMGGRGAGVLWGLPGNPWSAQFIFQELIAPMLWKSQGIQSPSHFELPGRTSHTIRKRKGFHKGIRGTLVLREGAVVFKPAVEGLPSMFELVRDHFAYTLLGPDVVEVPAGGSVRVRVHDLPCLALQWADTAGSVRGCA